MARTTLAFSIARPDGTRREEKLALELVEQDMMERFDGVMRRSTPKPTYVLRLAPAEARKFADILKSALAKDRGAKRTFSVTAPFSTVPR